MLYSGSSSIGHECKSSVPLLLFCLEQIFFPHIIISIVWLSFGSGIIVYHC